MQAFWEKWYVPNNATLVIVGSAKHADAQALAEKYFGWIPKCPAPGAAARARAAQAAAREARISEDKGSRAHCGLRLSGRADRAQGRGAAGDVDDVVGGGESSRLNQDLVKNQKSARRRWPGSCRWRTTVWPGPGGHDALGGQGQDSGRGRKSICSA